MDATSAPGKMGATLRILELIRVSTGKEPALAVGSDEEVVSFASTLVAADPDQASVVPIQRLG